MFLRKEIGAERVEERVATTLEIFLNKIKTVT